MTSLYDASIFELKILLQVYVEGFHTFKFELLFIVVKHWNIFNMELIIMSAQNPYIYVPGGPS